MNSKGSKERSAQSDDERLLVGLESLLEEEGIELDGEALDDSELDSLFDEDDEAGELPKAFIVPAPNATPSLEELQAFMGEHVASYKLVREMQVVEAIPKSASGKILRRELREQA